MGGVKINGRFHLSIKEEFLNPSLRKSGAGCSLQDTDIVGGDLPVSLGGGGVTLDRDSSDQCFTR